MKTNFCAVESGHPPASRSALSTAAAAATWIALLVVVLLTTLLLEWVLLGIVLVGSGPSSTGQPVPAILASLVALACCLAWVTTRYVASARKVGLVIRLLFALVSLVGVTWALSSPDQAQYFANEIAWDGSSALDYKIRYPQRPVNNAPPAFQFRQSLDPHLLDTVQYTKGGHAKQESLAQFLESTQTTSLIVIRDGSILYEGYASGYTRDSTVVSFSIAKSFTSALIGIAIDEGFIGSVDDPIISYLPELRDKGLDGVTLRHLLTMSAGIDYQHEDEQAPLLNVLPFNDDARFTNFPNLRSLALSVRRGADAPGTVFEYNNFGPLLLGMILERTTHRPVAQ